MHAIANAFAFRRPSWWPSLVWRHEKGECFGAAPVRKLLGVAFGADIYFGLVLTGRSEGWDD